MISKKLQYIFVHLPKTAGTSIESALISAETSKVVNKNTITIDSTIEEKFFCGFDDRHKSLSQIIKKFNINDLKNYFIFSVTRNPYSRFVSSFCHNLYVKNNLLFANNLIGLGNDQIQDTARFLRLEAENKIWGNFIEPKILIKEFRKFAKEFNQSIFETKVFNKQTTILEDLNCYNLIAKYENLKKDWAIISKKILKKETKLPSLNQTLHIDYKLFYDNKTKLIVGDIYNDDFKILGYKKDTL